MTCGGRRRAAGAAGVTTGRRGRHVGTGLAVLGLAVALTACLPSEGSVDGASPSPSGPPPDPSQVLRDLELGRLQALVDVDLPILEEVHAEEFALVSPPGTTIERDELLSSLEEGSLEFLALQPLSDIEVRVYGDGAVLTYRSLIRVDVSGTGDLDHQARHTVVYERDSGAWQAVWEQSTAVGGFPPP